MSEPSMGDRASGESLKICRDIDMIWCSRQATRFAEGMGFGRNEIWKISISVRELTSNVLKFAGTGTLTLCRVESPQPGIAIIVEDEGPGIDDIEAALIDGYSEGRLLVEDRSLRERRGLGTGLGAVARLMDQLKIENNPKGGVKVAAYKWLRE